MRKLFLNILRDSFTEASGLPYTWIFLNPPVMSLASVFCFVPLPQSIFDGVTFFKIPNPLPSELYENVQFVIFILLNKPAISLLVFVYISGLPLRVLNLWRIA